VKYKGKSIFEYGDVSTCSFHATKLFHTAEGGAVFCKDEHLFHKLFYSHNFGHNGPLDFHGLGINAKISELQAAMGLAVLPHLSEIIMGRKGVVEHYDSGLSNTKIQKMKLREANHWNYSYYPILLSTEQVLLTIDTAMKAEGVTCRRYFYPTLNSLNYLQNQVCRVSEDVAKRILCLPLYPDLNASDVNRIIKIINEHAE
jgi:dTDP-4-amino-4,6-dideoxygalactose transaminase